MTKGYVFFKDGKIPFVINNYCMELFSDDTLLQDFCNTYNFKYNYILEGQVFDAGIGGRKALFLVEHSIGYTCYLKCYIINITSKHASYDHIGLQSPFLDGVFRYNYHYIDLVRNGVNLALKPEDVYKIPFQMNGQDYDMLFRIGHNNDLGLLEDLGRKGELILPLHTADMQECYNISLVLYRLAMFMTSQAEVPFKRIALYNNGFCTGWFYCPLLSEEAFSYHDFIFYDFDVNKFIPRILNNIALDPGNKIVKSIPLGHLGDSETMFSPHRFMEQVMAFEYLFDKLDHKKAKDKKCTLKMELEEMFTNFPQLLTRTKISEAEASEQIKNIRHSIAHGSSYCYDFKNDRKTQYLMLLLDNLIRCMSLKLIGFTDKDILDFKVS